MLNAILLGLKKLSSVALFFLQIQRAFYYCQHEIIIV